MPSQRGSLISGTADPPYRFQPIDQRTRSASGYVDDYYGDSDERSFICSKPGFVCAAAVLFTVSFIALAFFIETGLPWYNKPPTTQVEGKVAGAGHGFLQINPSERNRANSVDGSEEESVKKHPSGPEMEDVEEQPRTPPKTPKTTARPISRLSAKQPKDALYIYTPFDDKSTTQSRVIRFLMDAQGFSSDCFTNFTFHEAADFLQVGQSSESLEENIHSCKNLDQEGFANLRDRFKNNLRKKSKYLFVIRDPRSVVYKAFNKLGSELENCRENISYRCLYNDEILNEMKQIIQNWNTTTAQMIEICEKLKHETCRIILIERLILKPTETLNEMAQLLTMDENKDVYRMLKKMVATVDEENLEIRTEKQREIIELISFLIPDPSNTWPWSCQLPFNIYEQLPQWAPLMGKIGYGFTSAVPNLNKDFFEKP